MTNVMMPWQNTFQLSAQVIHYPLPVGGTLVWFCPLFDGMYQGFECKKEKLPKKYNSMILIC
jgi:hypothetical protein